MTAMDIVKQGPPSESAPARTPKKDKKARTVSSRSTAAVIMTGIGSWVAGAVLLALCAALAFGPAFIAEMEEDKIMSVLDMTEGQIADIPMGDLIDMRKYVDEYEADEDVNNRAAEKAGKILDEAIEQRIDAG